MTIHGRHVSVANKSEPAEAMAVMENLPQSQETPPTNKDGEMKRTALWVLVLCLGSAGVVFALRTQERQIAKAPAAAATPTPPTKAASEPPPGKSVHTFADEKEMEQFAQVWRQRQAAMLRSDVLGSYLKQEQQTLNQINEELLSKYSLDVSKAYTLDTEHKTLIEREGPPPGQAPGGTEGKLATPPVANKPPYLESVDSPAAKKP